MKIIESTEELDNDLAGVMTLQRRLSGMERDLAAIQAKVIFIHLIIFTLKVLIYCEIRLHEFL